MQNNFLLFEEQKKVDLNPIIDELEVSSFF